jgi:D-alanyl-D-alanine carboxypeptidase (penicillin-binding protein 5/6)
MINPLSGRCMLACCVLLSVVGFLPLDLHAEPATSTVSREATSAGGRTQAARLPWRRVPAGSILLKDLNSGTTLYQFQSERRLSPASLT